MASGSDRRPTRNTSGTDRGRPHILPPACARVHNLPVLRPEIARTSEAVSRVPSRRAAPPRRPGRGRGRPQMAANQRYGQSLVLPPAERDQRRVIGGWARSEIATLSLVSLHERLCCPALHG